MRKAEVSARFSTKRVSWFTLRTFFAAPEFDEVVLFQHLGFIVGSQNGVGMDVARVLSQAA
jgi:hypothetical protein